MKADIERSIRAIEHLKDFLSLTTSCWKDGLGTKDVPITPEIKLALDWGEVQATLFSLSGEGDFKAAWIRVEVPPLDPEFTDDDQVAASTAGQAELDELLGCDDAVLTSRLVGARESDHTNVYYVTIRADTYKEAAEWVARIRAAGFKVRDWTFGCHRLT